ncbi:hypothetical protein GCM10023331_23230 [Algivirga pacifica]|uniref:DUF1573 domain-containing protein n=2 Tax=Algivirga pacifica TaxID=1162670 RepID=A0ABP9DBU5_9BACT
MDSYIRKEATLIDNSGFSQTVSIEATITNAPITDSSRIIDENKKPFLLFDHTEKELIYNKEGLLTTTFRYTNTGKETLFIDELKSACYCLNVQWSKQTVESGDIGELTITVHPDDFPGFEHYFTVKSNHINGKQLLKLTMPL